MASCGALILMCANPWGHEEYPQQYLRPPQQNTHKNIKKRPCAERLEDRIARALGDGGPAGPRLLALMTTQITANTQQSRQPYQ